MMLLGKNYREFVVGRGFHARSLFADGLCSLLCEVFVLLPNSREASLRAIWSFVSGSYREICTMRGVRVCELFERFSKLRPKQWIFS